MKAMLLRVGIDKSSDGILSPIFPDGTFEYIPLSEKDDGSNEIRTYHDLLGHKGKPLSTYLPTKLANRKVHLDPEFTTFTYGDTGRKANYLSKLNQGDLLVFYAGLTPYKDAGYPEALYIMGYFTVKKIWAKIDEPRGTGSVRIIRKKYPNNSHPKRVDIRDMVLVVGDPGKSKLLEKGILISQKKINKIGRRYHAVSPQMEELLGIKGSIQRSIPPRFIEEEHNIGNLKKLLGLTV
ncbi:hypothetical protein [Methanobacterium petrolearium]|uniref:Nmad3 family putative nucleotide modification protein n=1 Tax=Methanobacterium petrolearium TaxID=710190 RepID=UPI001AE3CC59|nr:hypothetical protein [Methanobacterium petrolearium]MBP1945189.1 hypothetical protein [Methanobacterium petrolearium]BDZ71118.1 hypothetical protein GCM10025861_16350 [Methanobacterium petrolearium]